MTIKFGAVRGAISVVSDTVETLHESIGRVFIDMSDTSSQPITWGIDRPLTEKEADELEKLILPLVRIFDKKIAEVVSGYLTQINDEE